MVQNLKFLRLYKLGKFYADLPAGLEGLSLKEWVDPNGNAWVYLHFGKMQDGKNIRRRIPRDCLIPAPWPYQVPLG